jgi:hypothetical protein
MSSPTEVPSLDREALKYLKDEQLQSAWANFLAQIAAGVLQAHINATMNPGDRELRETYERFYWQNQRAIAEFEARWKQERSATCDATE